MKRFALVALAALVLCSPVLAQRPSVLKTSTNPQGTACTVGSTVPILGYDDGTTVRWYYCNTNTLVYTIVGSGVGDMVKATYDPDSLSGAKVVTHATDCQLYTCDSGAGGYFCVDLDDNKAWICDGPAADWEQLPGSGGTDTTCATAGVNCTLATGDVVPWSIITNPPTGIADGDDDTTIADGLVGTTGQAIKLASTGPNVYQFYTPNLCKVGETACNLHASTTVDSLSPCLSDGTNCPSGITDTGPIPDGCTNAEVQTGDNGGASACVDPILESELASLGDLGTQIGLTGTADETTYLRGDGAWAAASAVAAFTDLTDVDTDYTGDGLKFLRVNTGATGIEFVDLLSDTNTWDAVQTFTAQPKIMTTAPALYFDQSDGAGTQNALIDVDGGVMRFSGVGVSDDLVDFSPFQMALGAATNSLYLASTGFLGIGTASPSYSLHSYAATGARTLKVESDNDMGGLFLDGRRSGSDGTFARIVGQNGIDSSIAAILFYRVGADDASAIYFQTKATSPGVIANSMVLAPTSLTMGSGVDLAMATNDITGAGAGTFSGTVTAGAVSVPADATDGQYVRLYEDTDNGTNYFDLKVGNSALGGDYSCQITTDGKFPFGCLDPDMSAAWTGAQDFSAGTIEIASSTSLPGTCSTGMMYLDTDADTDGSLYTCVATDTWKEVDDDGGAGAGDVSDVGDCTGSACFTADGTGNSLYFEGTGADAGEVILTAADPGTTDYTVTLPATTGTVALVSGNLGTPSAIVMTNATGTAASLTAGAATTATTASVGTTVTITDNESTAENNPIVFVAGADPDGGNLGLETDGDAHYNPSTGTITATAFAGSGAAITSVPPAGVTAALKTESSCAYIEDPVTDEQLPSIWRAPVAVTITEIWCETDAGTVGLDLNIDDGTPLGINGSDISCAVSTGTSDSTFANSAALAQGNTLDIDVGTVATAVRLSVCWRYTYD